MRWMLDTNAVSDLLRTQRRMLQRASEHPMRRFACLSSPRPRAGEELAGAANFVLGVANHFVELGDPAHGAGQGKNGGEQCTGMPMARCTMPE
jgi:hypothetical protein